MRKIVFVATSLAVLFAGSAIAQSYSTLNGSAVKRALAGKTFVHAGGVTQVFNSNGSMSSSGMQGTWTVQNGQLCTTWAGIGSATCYRVARASDGSGLRLTASDGRNWTLSAR